MSGKDARPRLELKNDIEKADKDGSNKKPNNKERLERSWLPSDLQRAPNNQEQRDAHIREQRDPHIREQPGYRRRKLSPDPAGKCDIEEDTQGKGTRGRGRGRGRGDHKNRGPEQQNSGTPPDYPSVEVRGRGKHSRGRGGLRKPGSDSPGQM